MGKWHKFSVAVSANCTSVNFAVLAKLAKTGVLNIVHQTMTLVLVLQ